MAQNDNFSARTIILFLIMVPVIGYLLFFAYKKNTESESKAIQCAQDCASKGFPGHDFKWNIFTGPQCSCLGEQE